MILLPPQRIEFKGAQGKKHVDELVAAYAQHLCRVSDNVVNVISPLELRPLDPAGGTPGTAKTL